MDITSEQQDNALILKPQGRVDGQNAQQFHLDLESKLGGGEQSVIIDMSDIKYISSAGLRAILLIAKTMRARNTKFMLCSLADTVKQVFLISGFDKFVPLYETREESLASVADSAV